MGALTDFHFIRPMWLLALIPLLLLSAWLIMTKARSRRWSEVIDPQLLEHLLDQSASVKNRWPVYFVAAAWLLTCISLAGPTWQRLPQVVEKKADVMIVIIDMTLSMHATDVTPSRLLRARYKLLELLAQRQEGQTALVAYSGDAHIVSPLTDDSKTIAALVPALSPEVMPTIGSNAGAAFDIAAELIQSTGSVSSRIVWLTDELLDKDRKPVESIMAQYNIDLVVLGIGSEQGGLIKLPDGKFIKDNQGNLITAKLNRGELRQFVSDQGGRYIDLRSDNRDIDFALSESLFENVEGENTAKNESQRMVERWRDQGAWLALLLIPIVLFSFRRGWVLAIACVAVYVAPIEDSYALTWQDLWQTKDQQAKQHFDLGKHEEAAELFEDKQWQGVAQYESGNYAESAKSLAGIDAAGAHYNRGHALAHDGKLEEAIAAYDNALALDPAMDDAKKSKSIIEQFLKQQQQQQGQGEGENSDQQQESDQANQEGEQSNQQDGQQSENQAGQESENDSEQQDASQGQDSEQSIGQNGQQEQSEEQAGQQAEQEQNTEDSQEQQSLASSENKSEEEQDEAMPLLSEAEQLSAEQSQALQQWLRQIPDDPAGLLRRKFQYERQLKQRQGSVVEAEENGQIW